MLAKCISTKKADLPAELLPPGRVLFEEGDFPLILEKTYVVYALTVHIGHLWFYVMDEHCTDFPVWNPSHLFELTSPAVSKYWILGFISPSDRSDPGPIIAFSEWASDPSYYDRLTDGDAGALAVFRKYRALIDQESAGELRPD